MPGLTNVLSADDSAVSLASANATRRSDIYVVCQNESPLPSPITQPNCNKFSYVLAYDVGKRSAIELMYDFQSLPSAISSEQQRRPHIVSYGRIRKTTFCRESMQFCVNSLFVPSFLQHMSEIHVLTLFH